MKKILIAFAALIIIAVGLWFVFGRTTKSPTQQPPVTFPSSGQQSGTSTTASAGSFLSSPGVKADPNNPGSYFVGYVPSSDHQIGEFPYQITYIADTKYFTISLTQEPVGESRSKAENYLMQLLGATKDQMCSLNYSVNVPNDVNTQYAGMNLGFSFCPNAVQLPY